MAGIDLNRDPTRPGRGQGTPAGAREVGMGARAGDRQREGTRAVTGMPERTNALWFFVAFLGGGAGVWWTKGAFANAWFAAMVAAGVVLALMIYHILKRRGRPRGGRRQRLLPGAPVYAHLPHVHPVGTLRGRYQYGAQCREYPCATRELRHRAHLHRRGDRRPGRGAELATDRVCEETGIRRGYGGPGGAFDDGGGPYTGEWKRLHIDTLPYGKKLSEAEFTEAVRDLVVQGRNRQVRTYECVFSVMVWDKTPDHAKEIWKDWHDRIIEGSFSAYTVQDLQWKGVEVMERGGKPRSE